MIEPKGTDTMRRRLHRRWGLVACVLLCLTACAGYPDTSTASKKQTSTVTPLPTMTATPSPLSPITRHSTSLDSEAAINRIISGMTLQQKIAQLLMVEFEGTTYNSDMSGMVRDEQVGGIIIYNNNARTIPQMQTLLNDVQANTSIPMMIALDQEGGDVNRLSEFYGAAPSAAQLAATGQPAQAQAAGALAAQRMLTLGMNVDLAPVVDVRSIPNPIEGQRIWSNSTAITDQMAGAFLAGLQSQGVAGCLKHWPGIGSLTLDPHKTLPTVTHSVDQLNTLDFAAFKGLLPQGPAMVMVTGVLYPAIDPDLPATLSPKLVDGVLRGQLGYQGVVITDQLHMKGISDHYPLGEAGVLSVLAGDDILEGAFDYYSARNMINALTDAVQSGRIPLSRIEESDRRILRVKWAYAMGLDKLQTLAGPDPTYKAPTA